jgi:hypothetical protein
MKRPMILRETYIRTLAARHVSLGRHRRFFPLRPQTKLKLSPNHHNQKNLVLLRRRDKLYCKGDALDA